MKTLSSFVLTLSIAASPAFAKPATFKDMKKDAEEFAQIFDNQTEECDVRVKETREGMYISVKKPGKPVVYLDVASDAKINVVDKKSGDDYDTTYTVAGGDKLELVHADDAFDHLYVTVKGEKISCELDF